MSKKVKDDINNVNPYEVDKFSKIPSGLIVILLKVWAAAAAVFLFMGSIELGIVVPAYTPDRVVNLTYYITAILIIGFIMTVLNNYAVRIYVRLTYNRRNNTYKYNMVNVGGLKSLFINLGYFMLISVILFFAYYPISSNYLALNTMGSGNGQALEPFTYGFLFFFVDAFFVLIKNLIQYLYKRNKYYKQLRS